MTQTAKRARAQSACTPQQLTAGGKRLSEINSLMDSLGVDRQEAFSLLVLDVLDQVREAIIEPPRAIASTKEVLIIVRTVVTAGTPVQGPSILVPRGFPTIVRQRRHSDPIRTGYVAFERSDTGNTLNRIEFRDNDSIALRVSRLDSLWFDADNNDTSFELIAEYGQRREVD